MDDIDARQASQIDQLEAAARDNQRTDTRQWIAMTLGIAVLFVYVSLIMGSVIRSQQAVIERLEDKCK